MSDDDIPLDPEALIKRLAPDQLGQFEPLSGMLLLNVSEEYWQGFVRREPERTATPEDKDLCAVMDHETYHFAQAAASGYMFERQRTALRFLNAAPSPPDPLDDPRFAEMVATAREAYRDDPVQSARVERVVRLMAANRVVLTAKASAPPRDHSMSGALLPDFFSHLSQRRADEAAANAHGLSILGVIEGSAVIAAKLLRHNAEDAAGHVRDELAALPPVYSELLTVTHAHAGARTFEVALPATAVALCYARPHDAYCGLLPMFVSAPPGQAFAHGRALFEAPPAIEAAGPWLGDALAQREADDSYRVYDGFHGPLRSNEWGVGAYDLLADPHAVYRTKRQLGMAVVTRSNWHGAFEQDELGARMYLMSVVLKALSRLRYEREFWKDVQDWGLEARHRMIGGRD